MPLLRPNQKPRAAKETKRAWYVLGSQRDVTSSSCQTACDQTFEWRASHQCIHVLWIFCFRLHHFPEPKCMVAALVQLHLSAPVDEGSSPSQKCA